MTKRRIAAALLLALLLFSCPPVAASADISSGVGTGTEMGSGVTKPYRRDENYVDVQPGDVDVWDNGKGISISGGGETFAVDYTYSDYLVLVSKYLDEDGGYTTQILIYMQDGYIFLKPSNTSVYDDGSVYFRVWVGGSGLHPVYSVKVRGGLFLSPDGVWTESAVAYSYYNLHTSPPVATPPMVFVTPYYTGKYLVYSSHEHVDSNLEGFPVNLLPNAPLGAGSTNIPYKTTFRMLTDGAAVYNTFYYTSSYMSGADTISASGTIRLDATKLADGSVTRTRPTAPQLLCQKSSYGTAYDIVYTNDNNLLSLLGIEKPPEKYWDVSAQEWKPVPSSGSGGTGGDTPAITPEPGINTIDPGRSPLSNFVTWLAAKGYPVAADVVYFLGDVDSAYGAFESLLEEYLGFYTYNESIGRFGSILDGVSDDWKKISDSPVADLVKKDFTDRFSLDTAKNTYTWLPSKLVAAGVAGIDTALGVGASGTGGTGSGSGGTGSGGNENPSTGTGTGPGSGGSGNPSSGTGSGGITIIDGPGWDIIGDISSSVQTDIVDGVTSTGGFLSGVLGSARGILLDLGGVPALLAEFFSFLPPEVITAIGIGLSLWLLPALLGLARSGLRGLGSICSSFFGFISSLFG